jgi:uncharacterized membrane protein
MTIATGHSTSALAGSRVWLNDLPNQDVSAEEYVDADAGERLSFGDIVADRVTREIGSWRFILVYFGLLIMWIGVNTIAWMRHWDPYPFIFLNLVLSFQGAFAAPVILMSQNRQEKKDRVAEACDHAVNLQAERSVESLQMQIEELGRVSLADMTSLRHGQLELTARLDTLVSLLERDRRGRMDGEQTLVQ